MTWFVSKPSARVSGKASGRTLEQAAATSAAAVTPIPLLPGRRTQRTASIGIPVKVPGVVVIEAHQSRARMRDEGATSACIALLQRPGDLIEANGDGHQGERLDAVIGTRHQFLSNLSRLRCVRACDVEFGIRYDGRLGPPPRENLGSAR